jgi:Survival protein SurE
MPVRGTPTDCVIMGALHLLSGKGPDLVLSGVNRGSNVGEDVIPAPWPALWRVRSAICAVSPRAC